MSVTILSAENLGKRFGTHVVFSGVTFQLHARERVGLVGVNGAGKSTLLRILAGVETPDEGSIVTQRGLRIAYLAQENHIEPQRSVFESALDAMREVRSLGEEIERLTASIAGADEAALPELLAAYEEKLIRFEAAGGYDLEHRAAEVLAGLGFSGDDFDRPAGHLSGGQRTRLALARVLLSDPDLLLLDEPTNHLDLQALAWLEGFLRSWRGSVVVVSHDRYFLDQVTERTLELSFGTIEDYPGNYTRYLQLRSERQARRWAEYEAQQAFIRREEEFIRRYRAGQRAREARGRATRLARLERIAPPREHAQVRLHLDTTLRSGQTVLSTTALTIGYAGSSGEPRVLFRTPELLVERGERVAVIGPNGAGKTTLLRVLLGQHKPLAGRVRYGSSVRLAYFAQGHEQLDPDKTVLSTLLAASPMSEEAARAHAARFLFSGDDVGKRVGSLSGGERSRLALALLSLERANVLLLDEPTNHLDVSSRESLEAVLEAFEGTVVFVSHDRYLIDRLATRVWAVEDGTLSESLGNFSDYQRHRAARANGALDRDRVPSGGRAAPAPGQERSARRLRSPRQVERDLHRVEERVVALEARLDELADALEEATARQDLDAVSELGTAYDAIQRELEDASRHWEALVEELEAVKSSSPGGAA